MKLKINRHTAAASLFLSFVFVMLGGTLVNTYRERDKITGLYSGYLGTGTGAPAKSKAAVLTAFESLASVNDDIFAKSGFINLYGLTQRVVGNRCVLDKSSIYKVVKLENGSLTYVEEQADDLPEKAARLSDFNNHLQTNGIPLLYVQLPFKINKDNKGLPPGIADYSNENADRMLAALSSRGVDTYDLRDEIVADKLDYPTLFFKTDHHWTPETGLWAAQKIAGKLNSGYGFNIDLPLLEKSRFQVIIYANTFLGSMGKRVGQYYAGTDDFSLILPQYETDMRCVYNRVNGKMFERNGSFEDTWIFPENLKKDYFELNTYATYTGADYPLLEIANNLTAGKKILVLRDSFSGVLVPFLSLAAGGELHAIDPRYYKGSITDYVGEFKPDLVLVLYNPGVLREMSFFTY